MITGKYCPLHQFLATLDRREWETTFTEIERILGLPLPPSARRWTAWWENGRSHTQARAWLEAGWEVHSLDIVEESVAFARAQGTSQRHNMRRTPTLRRHEKEFYTPPPSVGLSGVVRLRLLSYVFVHAATIDPERGTDGTPLEFMPQSRYFRARTTRLNRYGAGPFCRFTVKNLPTTSGIYALTIDGQLVYVGIANDLARRWGQQGYATISPRNCYVGGQSTNCKVNNLILQTARDSRRIGLWIHETHAPKPIESRLIRRLDPPWNGQIPRSG